MTDHFLHTLPHTCSYSESMLCCRTSTQSAVDITLEDRTKELMEESRMLLVQFCIDRVSLGVHSMGKV